MIATGEEDKVFLFGNAFIL